MDSSMSIGADVLLTSGTSTTSERDVVEAFAAIGVAATTRLAPTRRTLSGVEWFVLAVLPLQAFLSGLGSKFAEDVHLGLKEVVNRIVRRGSEPGRQEPALVLQDTTTGLEIVLEPDLPTEAYLILVELDLSALHHGPVRYDRSRDEWRSDSDG